MHFFSFSTAHLLKVIMQYNWKDITDKEHELDVLKIKKKMYETTTVRKTPLPAVHDSVRLYHKSITYAQNACKRNKLVRPYKLM